MVVVLTVGLAVASRSITSLRTSTEEENSQRAFSAAEAGIEKIIKTGGSISNLSFKNNSTITSATSTEISGTQFLLNGGNTIERNDGADVWLVPHDSATDNPIYTNAWTGTSITVYWGSDSTGCSDPALEIVAIEKSGVNFISKRYAYDPCISRRANNKFTAPTSGSYNVLGKAFSYRQSIPVSSGLVVRVIPLYFSAKATGIDLTGPAVSQGKKVEAVGKSGDTERKISMFQGYPKISSEYFYVLLVPKNQ